jgi:hypothetical protein
MTFQGFVTRFDDWLNPIAVKEMRQAVKGRFIAWTLMIFLLIQLIIIGAVLMLSEDLGQDFNIGRNTFMGLLGVLLATCLLFLPAFTALRLSSEKSGNKVDLFFITSLRPIQIIWGKFSAGLVLTLLFFSVCMPFMTLTYLLRGLDLPSMFILLGFDFLVVAGCIQFGILVASLPGGAIARGARFLGGLFVLIFILQSTLMASMGMLFAGVGSSIASWDFWGPALTVTAFVLMGIGLLFILSVTIITPRSANKAFAARVYLLFIWLVSGVIAGIWSIVTSGYDPIWFWMIAMVLLFCVTLFVAICERQKWGPRIVRTIPRRRIFRIPAFFLYSGAANGIALSAVMIGLTILVTFWFGRIFAVGGKLRPDYEHAFVIAGGLALYAFCYALTALIIKRVFFANSTRANITAIIALLLLVAGTVVPMVIGFLLRPGPWRKLSPQWYIANPGILFWEKHMWSECLTFTGIWAAGVFAVTLPWFIRQVRAFKPTLKDEGQGTS